MNNYTQTIGTSIAMKFIERFGTQVVNIVLNVILVRLLNPKDYGTLAILNVFIVLAQVISQNGINNALIQRKNTDELDYSTALVLSLIFAGGIYFILFIFAKPISDFYSMPEISLYLRVLALGLFPGAINAIYSARIMKNMQFQIIMTSNIFANITSCTLGVIIAYCGFGVWSLIITQLSVPIILLVIMIIMVKERFSVGFSISKARSMMKYGNKIILASILDNIYYDFEGLLIGKILSKEVLGFFINARTYPLRVVSSIKDTIASVVFTALSNEQENIQRMREIYIKAIQGVSFIMFPLLFGFAIISEEFVRVLLTEKWMPCLFPMQVFSVGFAFLALSAPNIQVIKATGNSDLNLKIELIRKGIIFGGLIISVGLWGTIEAVSIVSSVTTIITAIMVSFAGGKIIGVSLYKQLCIILKTLISTCIMIISIYILSKEIPNEYFGYVSLLSKVLVGSLIYIIVSYTIKNPAMEMILEKLKNFYTRGVER